MTFKLKDSPIQKMAVQLICNVKGKKQLQKVRAFENALFPFGCSHFSSTLILPALSALPNRSLHLPLIFYGSSEHTNWSKYPQTWPGEEPQYRACKLKDNQSDSENIQKSWALKTGLDTRRASRPCHSRAITSIREICQFSFQSQRKAMPKNAQTTAQLHSSHMLAT